MMEQLTLASLQLGQRGSVIQVEGSDAVAIRLMEMGVVEGQVIELVGQAPFGDPLEFSVRGYRLSLRKAEAARVQIEPQS